MSYVKCLKNDPYIQPPGQELQQEPLLDLTVGHVYKVLPDPIAERHGMMRVIDESYGEPGSEDGYLYPSEYFQPFVPSGNMQSRATVTVHLDEYMKGVLQAEAVAANKSISALVRDWLEERLDLPAPA